MAALQEDRKAVNIRTPRAEQLVLAGRADRCHQLFQVCSSEVGRRRSKSSVPLRGVVLSGNSALCLLETCANVGKLVQLVKFHEANPSVKPVTSRRATVAQSHCSEGIFFLVLLWIQRLSVSEKSRRIAFSALYFHWNITICTYHGLTGCIKITNLLKSRLHQHFRKHMTLQVSKCWLVLHLTFGRRQKQR